jgi:hypothetical protein
LVLISVEFRPLRVINNAVRLTVVVSFDCTEAKEGVVGIEDN